MQMQKRALVSSYWVTESRGFFYKCCVGGKYICRYRHRYKHKHSEFAEFDYAECN
jgi:hypothetical protein